jgi:hypothetical protein
MKQVFTHWNVIRLIRLGLGIAIIVQAVIVHEIIMVLAGMLLSGMALFNIGCFGAGGCNKPIRKNTQGTKEIEYEEVV